MTADSLGVIGTVLEILGAADVVLGGREDLVDGSAVNNGLVDLLGQSLDLIGRHLDGHSQHLFSHL